MTSINELVKRNDISGLITALNEDAAWYTRDQAGKALIDIGEPAVEALLAMLKNNKAGVHLRLDVVKILKQIGDKRMLEPLIELFEDDNVFIRTAALKVFEQFDETQIQKAVEIYPNPIVLYITDALRSRCLLEAYLGSKGFDTLTTETILEGFQIATKFHPTIILVECYSLSDSIEFAETLKKSEKTTHIPMINIISDNISKEDVEMLLQAGYDEYEVKPMDIDNFFAKFKRHVL